MIIRKAEKGDIPELRRLYTELEGDAVMYQPEHFVIGYRDDGFFESVFDSADQELLVAEENGGVVGFAHVRLLAQKKIPCLKPQTVLYLQDLDVAGDRRGRGIGTALIDACREYGRKNGADFMRTQVFPQNIRGIRFYERCGFAEKMKTIERDL